jgi:hypothetical protein
MATWSVGVTTVPARRGDLLPRTLESMMLARFPPPRLFVDGEVDPGIWRREFGLEVTCRWPAIRTAGSWVLALTELLLRDPTADRYAVVQDDVLFCRNVRHYLDACPYPQGGGEDVRAGRVIPCGDGAGYWSLFTGHAPNERLAANQSGWVRSDQRGRGALAYVFSREVAISLLSCGHLLRRADHPKRGWRAIDGGVSEAARQVGLTEWIHAPSLCQHLGAESSSMGNDGLGVSASSFPGPEFDALTLLS